MASAEVLECPVCCEPFEDQNICPRILSCGHSFCTCCLERLLTADNKIPCPTCRDEVNVPQAGVAGLPKNFALLSIINENVKHHHQKGEGSYTCEACDDKHPATFFCLDCKEDMCKDAARFHTRNKASCDHKVVSLETSLVNVFCQEHKERFRLFDEVCGHVVCKGCIKLDHQGHNCSSLAEAASKCRNEMQELATKVNARAEVIKDGETQVVKASLNMEKAREEQAAEIHKLFKEIYAEITTKEQTLTKELEQLYINKAAILAEQQDRLCKFQESIASTVQSVLSRIRSSDDAELLVARSALESTLRERENQPMQLEPQVQFVPKLIFNRKKFQDLVDVLSNKVSVIDDSTCAENTIAEGMEYRWVSCGAVCYFDIIAHDPQNRRRSLGGDLFTVELKDEFGNEKATGDVEDCGNGTYWAFCDVPKDSKPGDYTVNVCLRGVHIHGSPFVVHVKPYHNSVFGAVSMKVSRLMFGPGQLEHN